MHLFFNLFTVFYYYCGLFYENEFCIKCNFVMLTTSESSIEALTS